MRMSEALIVAASGFLVVFIMLVLLWLIIVVINKVVSSIEQKPEEVTKEITPTSETVVDGGTYGGELALYGVDEKTAATIMAIVSDETKIPLNQLVFHSIKVVE